VADDLSNVQNLFINKGLKQASCFFASEVPQDVRLRWSDSLAKSGLRNDTKKLKESALFLVISQNCDIASRNDSIEDSVEIVVCKSIKSRDVYPGNAFVKSVRKLQFQYGDSWYEANSDLILTVKKDELVDALTDTAISYLTDEYTQTIPLWRSNRYMRTALPDAFNEVFFPVFDDHVGRVEVAAKADQKESFASYIRAIYIWLDSFEEQDVYSFDLFALLKDSVCDEQSSAIQEQVEALAEALSEAAGYDDRSEIYADRESNTQVSYLNKFVRLNLDHQSLASGDADTGPRQLD
jgi:hypothetical protein